MRCTRTVKVSDDDTKESLTQFKSEEEIKRLKEGFAKLTDIVSPYCDDFTGITENGEFDVVLAVQELLEIAYPKQHERLVTMTDEDETPFLAMLDRKE